MSQLSQRKAALSKLRDLREKLRRSLSCEASSSSDEEQTVYSRHEVRTREALVQGMGEALKNRATGLVDALLDPLATIEGYITLLSTIPQLPELIDQYVADFLYDLDDAERAEQLGKLLTEAVLLVVPSPSIPNLSGITKKLGQAVEKARHLARSVHDIGEFFSSTRLGKSLKNVSKKTCFRAGDQSIYKVTGKNKFHLKKGDHYYLDKLHRDHLEVFDAHGKFKKVINLDGTLNKAKTQIGLKKARTINIK